jgi:hypothetical protein
MSWKDYLESGTIIAGSPERVTEQLRDLAKNLRVGHLMALLHFGNLPKDRVFANTKLFMEKVAPNLRDIWDDEWEDRWWIHPIESRRAMTPAVSG